jgi:hypothetical protein
MDEFYQKAYELIASPAARKAFDIGAEPETLRDAYGRTGGDRDVCWHGA